MADIRLVARKSLKLAQKFSTFPEDAVTEDAQKMAKFAFRSRYSQKVATSELGPRRSTEYGSEVDPEIAPRPRETGREEFSEVDTF